MKVRELKEYISKCKDTDTVLVYGNTMSWDPEPIEGCVVYWNLDKRFKPFDNNINAIALNTHLDYNVLYWC